MVISYFLTKMLTLIPVLYVIILYFKKWFRFEKTIKYAKQLHNTILRFKITSVILTKFYGISIINYLITFYYSESCTNVFLL